MRQNTMDKQAIQTHNVPKTVGPYSQAIRMGNLLFTSGQIPLDPRQGTVVGQDIRGQATQVLENLKHLLEDAGVSLTAVLKTTMFLADMNDFAIANEVYGHYFKEPYPARSTIQVARLPKAVLVEIEAIAWIPS